ncbi:MAG: NAD(P)-dependent oxidoreductase, partial [Rhodobiaceae bacterium]|nr:NAD(P)-dependent oxidoreductase [Rhodobiaceae bacterium]
MRVLVTGATGKVGQHFITRFLEDPRWPQASVRALCHNRTVEPTDRIEVVKGSISDRAVVEKAVSGATHIVHLSTVKEDPDTAMDVSVKGTFLLLEAARASDDFRQFLHVSGDCAVGHIFQPYDGPVSETAPRKAYQGVYALSKVLEEAMLEQYYVQYDLNGCCLRAPWIMEKD